MNFKCFLIEPTEFHRVSLRRYISSDTGGKCPLPLGYHNAQTLIGDVNDEHFNNLRDRPINKFDPAWPKLCACGYEFKDDDQWQVFGETIYARTDTGERMTLNDAPTGAMWDATWMHNCPDRCGPDGRCIIVKMPGGHHWDVDGRCSNCDQPGRPHKCWVRTGTPPNLNVTKGGHGESCNAGAGSIIVPGWHGFLHNGELRQC